MVAIITGDIVRSRMGNPDIWLPELTAALSAYADKFDIFRGDSFQAEIPVNKVLESVFYIKATLISIQLDARIGIGIGQKDNQAEHLKHTFGSALVYSGEAFDELKKETVFFRSADAELDALCNTVLPLLTEISSRWTSNIAATVKSALMNEEINQVDLAKLLGKKHQSQISTELQKAGFSKMQRALNYCTKNMLKL